MPGLQISDDAKTEWPERRPWMQTVARARSSEEEMSTSARDGDPSIFKRLQVP